MSLTGIAEQPYPYPYKCSSRIRVIQLRAGMRACYSGPGNIGLLTCEECKGNGKMLTETMFTLGRRYALSGREAKDLIMRDALSRMSHWSRKEGEDMHILFSCFVEGARSAETEYKQGLLNTGEEQPS